MAKIRLSAADRLVLWTLHWDARKAAVSPKVPHHWDRLLKLGYVEVISVPVFRITEKGEQEYRRTNGAD